MDKFLNFYTKYPWVAIIIVMQWLTTAFIIIYARDIDVTKVMGLMFFWTVVYAYFGFKIPKG
jgi:hypothetical protein